MLLQKRSFTFGLTKISDGTEMVSITLSNSKSEERMNG